MADARHGWGRISAALSIAPAAGALALLALLACLPFPADVGMLIAFLAMAPALSVGAASALLARSGASAWIGSALVAGASGVALVLA